MLTRDLLYHHFSEYHLLETVKWFNILFASDSPQGLILKEKDINAEKKAQISIVAKKTLTQRWLQIMIMENKRGDILGEIFVLFPI